MTPRELWIWSRTYRDRIRDEARMRRVEIYTLSALIRSMVWAKHPPKFDKVFPDNRRRREMTDEEMKQQVLALNAMLGGRVREASHGSSKKLNGPRGRGLQRDHKTG